MSQQTTSASPSSAATNDPIGKPSEPLFFPGPSLVTNVANFAQRFFAYSHTSGLVTGKCFNVSFTLDGRTDEVWPIFKDFNLWQSSYGYHYTEIVGEAEGKRFFIEVRDSRIRSPVYSTRMEYEVVKVIPQHLIVLTQPASTVGATVGISPGFHVFTLVPQEQQTRIVGLMSHAVQSESQSLDEALQSWRNQALESQRFWAEIFIPNLQKLLRDNA